ncbi:MAG TPA: hypothetical protein IGS40_03425 [Trichormus sp. M33_DOE_039]|nr:hypothetical protein [Trichormus sp. M33_DOE_039]
MQQTSGFGRMFQPIQGHQLCPTIGDRQLSLSQDILAHLETLGFKVQ